MSRKVQGIVSLIIGAGQAQLSEALGPAIGAFGVNVDAFIKDFNAATTGRPAGGAVENHDYGLRRLFVHLHRGTADLVVFSPAAATGLQPVLSGEPSRRSYPNQEC